jgi:hypothetical protein
MLMVIVDHQRSHSVWQRPVQLCSISVVMRRQMCKCHSCTLPPQSIRLQQCRTLQVKAAGMDAQTGMGKIKAKLRGMPLGFSFVSVRQRLLEAICLVRVDGNSGAISSAPPSAMLTAYPSHQQQYNPSEHAGAGAGDITPY